jgi:hypothetical protein
MVDEKGVVYAEILISDSQDEGDSAAKKCVMAQLAALYIYIYTEQKNRRDMSCSGTRRLLMH